MSTTTISAKHLVEGDMLGSGEKVAKVRYRNGRVVAVVVNVYGASRRIELENGSRVRIQRRGQ